MIGRAPIEELRFKLEGRVFDAERRIHTLEEKAKRAGWRASALLQRMERPPASWGGVRAWGLGELEGLKHRWRWASDSEAKATAAAAKTRARLEVLRARLASIPEKLPAARLTAGEADFLELLGND